LSSPFTPYLSTVPKAFVGREQEITDFQRFLKDAKDSKPSSVLLTGQRGIGKTVLLQFAFLDRQEGVAANEVSNKISTYVGPYIKELETKGFIVKASRGKYRITDNLFRNWLCKKYKN